MAGGISGTIDVAVRFLTDTSKVEGDVAKVTGTGDKIKGWAKGIGVALGGAFAVKTVSDWIGAAEEANSVSAGLAQSLANAGDATGEWTKHAEELANTLQYKTGIDDEVIKGAQTILGTFHSVAGATGQASGAFDRATQAALDLSKAGFGDASSTATMLGKALEDPQRGLTALRRVGVNFTAEQENMIKGFLDAGDKAGAMNVILGNVESQVGGMAEKTATGTDKMKVAWGETQESLGKALIPALEILAPILQKVAGFIQENANWLVPMVAGIVALNIALSLSPITLIALGIAALIAGLILLWQNWDQVWTWITDAVGWAVGFILDHWQWIVGAIFPIIGAILLLWNNWSTIWGWIQSLVGAVVGWILDAWNGLLTFFRNIPGWIATALATIGAILLAPFQWGWNMITSLWNGILGFFRQIPGWIGSALSTVGGIIVAPFQWAWDQVIRIKDGIVGVFQSAVDGFKNIWNGFARFWNGIELDVPGITMPGPIPDIPGFTLGLPDLPMFAKGGIVTRPTLAILGEAGAEAVVPLGQLNQGTTIVVNVTTTGLGADTPSIQRAVVATLRNYVTTNGPISGIAS